LVHGRIRPTDERLGILIGAAGMIGDNLALGVMFGTSQGRIAAAVPYGQTIETSNHIAGLYGRFDAENFYLGFGLTGGISGYDSARQVTNNMVGGDTLETAIQSYSGFFLSPEITIGTDNFQIGGFDVRPSATIRYSKVFSDGFSEHGVTEGALTIGDRQTDVIDARFQVAIPVETGLSQSKFEVRAGLDARAVVAGGEFDATLLGTTVNGFEPGQARHAFGGFAALDFTHQLSDNAFVHASAEAGFGSERAFHASGQVGLRVDF
jgi:outer membrane autotransporter protein